MTSPATLTKALLRGADQLGLLDRLPAILQISDEEIARLQAGESALDPQSDAWGRALKVVGLFRTLTTLLGSPERGRAWLATAHQTLGARPAEVLASPDSERVYRYLDAVSKHELRLS